MRDLQLLADYLVRLRQEKLQLGHSQALADDPRIIHLVITAHEAELCSRILAAVKVLERDSGKFIQEYLS